MDAYFATVFEDTWHERFLIILLSLADPEILKQSRFTDDETNILNNLAEENLHRQLTLQECFAVSLIEQCVMFNKGLKQI